VGRKKIVEIIKKTKAMQHTKREGPAGYLEKKVEKKKKGGDDEEPYAGATITSTSQDLCSTAWFGQSSRGGIPKQPSQIATSGEKRSTKKGHTGNKKKNRAERNIL